MNNESNSDDDINERVEILKNKYLQKRNQVSSTAHTSDDHGRHGGDHGRHDTGSRKSKKMRDYETALKELHRALSHQPQSKPDSDEEDCLVETNVFCTETDVTLPSNLARSSSSSVMESELNGRGWDIRDRTQSSASGAGATVHVYQEMLHIYEKLQAERLSQQVWAAELCEREHELQQRENVLLQHQRNIQKLRGAAEEVQTLQQQYEQEIQELKAALKQKNKDNKRIKSSFDSMKELNDSLRKQLTEASEQNRKLESQSGKVQARLENLQRKYEHSVAHSCRENVFFQAYDLKPGKQEKPRSNKASKEGGAQGPAVKLLAALLDWVVDGQLIESRERSNLTVCDPRGASQPSLQDRCSKVLPLLVELLQTPVMEQSLQLSLLRCIYSCLLQLERSTQHAPLTSTLRRLGEEVSRGPGDPGNVRSPRVCPLFKSSCLHTRFLCSLIMIKTVTQVDVLAQAVDVLSCAVRTDEGQQLFLQYQALSAVLALLRGANPGLLTLSVDILLQMSTQSRLLTDFLKECSTDEFFRSVSLVLRNPRLEPVLLERISMLLQKLSSIRKNKRLFEAFSLHLLLQEMHRTADPAQVFLSMNLNSILLNLGMLTRS